LAGAFTAGRQDDTIKFALGRKVVELSVPRVGFEFEKQPGTVAKLAYIAGKERGRIDLPLWVDQAERVYFDWAGLTLCLLRAGSYDSGKVSFESLLGEHVPVSRAFASYEQARRARAAQRDQGIEADGIGAAISDFLPDSEGVFALGNPDLAREFHAKGGERVFN
jgi:hypothetical protein